MRSFPSLGGAFVAAILFVTPISFVHGHERDNPVVRAVAKTQDAIVTIKSANANSSKGVAGTGVIVDKRGLIITNKHVVGSRTEVVVSLANGVELAGRVINPAAHLDLAAIKVDLLNGKELPELRLATTQDLMVGEDVIAIGHPYGYVNTVSRGIISALGREINLPSGHVLKGLIQTDASINPGNSGGPLLNINGELIGINVALRDGAQGIAFAINASTVEKYLASTYNTKVAHGLKTQEKVVAGDRQRLEVLESTGNLKAGDQIVTVADNAVGNSFDLARALSGKKAGDNVQLKVVRQGGQTEIVTLTLAAGQGAGAVATVTPSTSAQPQRVATNESVPASNRR
jgi:serine protease Do